jgi:enoyl-CoA hydratase
MFHVHARSRVVSGEHLLVEREGHVMTLTMNRPEARNAFGLQMLAELADAWDEVEANTDIRAVILTGAGGNFCAGSDLKLMSSGYDDPLVRRFKDEPGLHWRALLRHHRPRVPVIAAVEGYAFAGGTEILQGTDIRVAAKGSKFGVTEVRLGLFPLGGSTVRLRRQIPHTVAMDMLLAGRILSAEEALGFGLVGRLVEAGEALTAAHEVASQVASYGPLAVEAVKRSAYACEGLPEVEALALELEIGQPVFATEDAKEGPLAFVQKRKPEFKRR